MSEMEYQTKVIASLTRLETKMDNVCGRQKDHEKRIRFLERSIYVAIGILIIVQVAVGAMLRSLIQ